MKYEDFEHRLEQVLSGELASALPNMITVTDHGYEVFGLYEILAQDGGFAVFTNGNHRATFSSTRVALSWCIAEKYNQYALSRNILMLDQDQQLMSRDLEVRRDLVRQIKETQRHIIARDKLENREFQLRQVKTRLSKCVNLAKYFQLRGFNDEIARTRRPTPNRTSNPGARRPKRASH